MANLYAYLSDNVTAANSISFSAIAGSTTSATQINLWENKGVAGSAVYNIGCYLEIEDPAHPGTWFTVTGHPALANWFQIRVIGGLNTANDSRFVADASGGSYAQLKGGVPFLIPSLFGNTARYLDVRITAPITPASVSSTFNWRLRFHPDDVVTRTDSGRPQGILRMLCDTSVKEFITAPVITATGTPDDQVHGTFHSTNWLGLFKQRAVVDALTLNQADGASASLAAAQEYKALISRSSDHTTALTVTKGVKAATGASVAPALPAGNLPVALVTVPYHVTASVITNANIIQYAVDGWAHVTAGTGLNATIGTMYVQTPSVQIRHCNGNTAALTASSTNRLWLTMDGSFVVVTTDDNPPRVGSEWLATLTTDGSGVTAITDKRRFEDSAGQWMELQVAAGNEATGTAVARRMVPFAHQVVSAFATMTTASSGATGATTFDVNRKRAGASATVFTNQGGATETRPSIAAQAYTASGTPELTSDGNAGDVYSADVDAITSGGSRAADLSVSLLIYPRP